MLSANEFTVGTLADATPGSLMLPRSRHEAAALVGQIDGHPAAVFLNGDFKFQCFESSEATNWRGLLISNVRVEVDEASLFDPQSIDAKLGTVLRTGTQLAIYAKPDRSVGRSSMVSLETGLAPTNGLAAGFSQWRVVIGEAQDKRILLNVETGQVSHRD